MSKIDHLRQEKAINDPNVVGLKWVDKIRAGYLREIEWKQQGFSRSFHAVSLSTVNLVFERESISE